MKLLYVNESLNKKLYNTIFNFNDVKNFIEGFCGYTNISSYLNNINPKKLANDNLAMYDIITHDLNIDLDAIINDAKDGYGKEDSSELVLFINIMIIYTLVHEITHIYQRSIENNGGVIPNIIRAEFNLVNILDKNEYYKYWSYFTFEREATFNANEYVLFLLRTVVKNEEMYEYFRDNYVDLLISGYSFKNDYVSSPLQVINKRFRKKMLPKICLNDIYLSLKYGFPITKDEYQHYKENGGEIVDKKITCMK